MFLKSVFYTFLCALLLASYFAVISAIPPKKLYEQTCSNSEDCDQTQGLTCQNSKCRCDPNGATVYSLGKNRCVGAAGRECLVIKNSSLCVEHAKCNNYGYNFNFNLCTCENGYYQSKDGNCYPVSKYGDVCLEEDFSCGDTISSSISCVEKKCRCILGDENQSYDPKEQKCTSFAGGQCIENYYKSCPNNSFCGEFSENIDGASFMAGHRCICAIGFSQTRNKQCLARYGTLCGTNNPCNYDEFLGCINGKCQCRNPLNEVFNEVTQKCAILVGSTCKLGDSKQCVDNAICVIEKNSTSSTHGKCVCKPSHSVTPSNMCLLDINQKCDSGQLCNFYNALACINETCNCIDSYLSYDKVSKSCVSLVGLPCGTVSLLHEEKDKEVIVLCEASATCSKGIGLVGHYNGAAKRICKPSPAAKQH